jgi:hypothetical protein
MIGYATTLVGKTFLSSSQTPTFLEKVNTKSWTIFAGSELNPATILTPDMSCAVLTQI